MQSALSSVSYSHRSEVKDRIAQFDSFDSFDLLPSIKESIASQVLKGLTSIVPTPVQRVAIPALLGMEPQRRKRDSDSDTPHSPTQFLLAAETGSGKTLAYLLPVIDALKREELAAVRVKEQELAGKESQKTTTIFEVDPPPMPKIQNPNSGRPRAIILVPTGELASQVGSLAKLLSHTIKFKTSTISAAVSGTVIRNRLFSPAGVDVLVSTPHLLASIAESEPNILSKVTHLVIDEADSLLDRSFAPITSTIIDRSTPSLHQLILCSATVPKSFDSYLHKRFPELKRLVTPNLHAIPRRVQLAVVDVEKHPYQGNKDLACAEAIWSIGRSTMDIDDEAQGSVSKQILVFVNEREKTTELSQYLISKGIDAIPLNRDSMERTQSHDLASLTSSDSASMPLKASAREKPARNALSWNRAETMPRRVLPYTRAIVATDLGSRGIDTLEVRHVILYDVPHTTIDFIHRLGRTGRMGRRGRGIILVGKNDRKDVVKEVREGMFKGQALI